jgi:putative heme transporter
MAEDRVPQALKTSAGITWRLLILAAGLAVIGMILGRVFPVVFALFFALLVTAWGTPIMKLLQRFMPKVLAMISSLLLIIALIVLILGAVVTSSINEGPKLLSSITAGITEIETWLRTGPLRLDDGQISSLIDQAKGYGTTAAQGLLGNTIDALGSVGTLVIAGSVFIFAVIFFMMQPAQIWGWLMSWMPARARTKIDMSGTIAWSSISGYTRGIVIVALADATLVFIGLTLMQVPLAPALAALVFLGAFIPVIGAPIATFFAAIVALAERGPVIALLVIALTVVVGSFDGDVLQPLVMGKAVNLHPLAIIIVIAAGSITLGIVGALIAVPIAGAFYGVLKYLTGRDADERLPELTPV